MSDACVIREGIAKCEALLLAKGGERWVWKLVVGFTKVVITLGVANAMDSCCGHLKNVNRVFWNRGAYLLLRSGF